VLFVLACAIRIAAGVITGGLAHPELFEYDAMAKNLLSGHGLTYTHLGIVYHSFAPPLYSWISAASYWGTGSIAPAMLLQIAAGSALAVVAAAIAQRLFSDRIAAIAAGCLVAVHPGLIVYSATKAHPLSYDALLFSLALWMFFLLYETPTVTRAMALGLIVGVGTLSRSTALIFLPIGAVWLLAVTPFHHWRAAVRALVIAGVTAFIVLLPWSIRDSLVHHRGLFLISTTGEDFWDGNNPYATGHSYIDADHAVINALPPEERADLERQPDEIAQSQWFMGKATAFIKADPERAARLTLVKFYHFWWFAPQTGVLYPSSWRQLYMAYYVAALVLAAAGVWKITQTGGGAMRRALLVGAFLLGLSVLQSVYYVEARHRWAIEPMLLAFSEGERVDRVVMTPDKPGVLMVTGAYFPELSGAGLQCREIVRQLRDAGDFTILTTGTDPSLPADDECDGVRVHRVFVDPNSAWSKIVAAARMTRVALALRGRFSILHLHGFSQKSILLVVLALVMRKRIAVTLTSVGHDDPVSMRTRGRWMYWSYARSHAFFGVSPGFQASYDASGLPRGRFRVIPNGVDLDRFRPATPDERRRLRDELGLPRDAIMILFIGFFSRQKSPDVLFDAWARMVARGDTSSILVLVGATQSAYYEVDANLADEIRRTASGLGLAARVHFPGVTRTIEKYHRAADIFVLPSVREGLPCALQEAMACGTACIATRLPGVTDVLLDDGVSGVLLPPRDVEAFQTALVDFISHPARARAMGERARQRIERDYAMAATARQYLSGYLELIGAHE
jgi:glycosyltransferase involved in cell wall biosynthesis/4-amino-4-deoxy-L-arabinose transferase-like glycosyltransferase